MSPKCLTFALPTKVARLPAPGGITRQMFQHSYSRALVLRPVPATILSRQQFSLVSPDSLEILTEEAIRTVHADGKEEESHAVTEHEGSHQVVAPRPGAMSC